MKVSFGILIVGYGKHVENKILPAIKELKIPLLGIVTLNKDVPKKITHYKNLKETYNKIQPSHIFIASDPKKNINLIKEASLISENLMVEKPIILNYQNLLDNDNLGNKNIIVKEAMMYKYNFLNIFLKKRKKIMQDLKEIKVNYILPVENLKYDKSFRNKPGIENSMLFDVGCYIYDFIWSFEIPYEKLFVYEMKFFNDGKPKFLFLKSNDKNKKKKLTFKFGYGKKYINQVEIISKYNISYKLSPFFYGRKSNVNIKITKGHKKYEKLYFNENCFVKMISEWYLNKKTSTQDELSNFNRISFIQNSLYKLSQNWRSDVQ